MYIHNKNIPKSIRNINERYNTQWINKHRFLYNESVSVNELDVDCKFKLDANPFMVVWLKNIIKLKKMLPPNCKLEEYNLFDVGCGTGISTLYFHLNYNFKSIVGFDFSENLILKANRNKEIARNYKKINNLEFINADAKYYKIINEKNILFLFNPFGWNTLELFIKNNLSILHKKKNIIAYANDTYINKLSTYSKNIIREDKFNLSLVFF